MDGFAGEAQVHQISGRQARDQNVLQNLLGSKKELLSNQHGD